MDSRLISSANALINTHVILHVCKHILKDKFSTVRFFASNDVCIFRLHCHIVFMEVVVVDTPPSSV